MEGNPHQAGCGMSEMWLQRILVEVRQGVLRVQVLPPPPEHHAQVIPHDQIGKLLPWVHVAISNAKRLLLDIYHDISPEYLQSYLNEFCYKFNRRYFGDGLFDRMLLAGITYKNEFRYNIK